MKDGVMDKDSIEIKDRGLRVSIFRWGFIDNSKLYFCIFFLEWFFIIMMTEQKSSIRINHMGNFNKE
jgi:hypothetical protein